MCCTNSVWVVRVVCRNFLGDEYEKKYTNMNISFMILKLFCRFIYIYIIIENQDYCRDYIFDIAYVTYD